MKYKLILRKKVIKFLQKRVPKDKLVIDSKLKLLSQNPYPTNNALDVKKLSNLEYFRLRVNNYRFIYEIIDEELVILMLDGDNRGDIY
jgi:mRNA interferase RelE/StbE